MHCILYIIIVIDYCFSSSSCIQPRVAEEVGKSVEMNLRTVYGATVEPADVEIVGESVEVEEIVVEEIVEESYFTEFETEYFARCVMAEAGDQDELGKRLVIDVLLNRHNSGQYGNSIMDVIRAKNQFEVVSNGSIDRVIPTDDIYTLIQEEVILQADYEVFYFRTDYFHNFGT